MHGFEHFYKEESENCPLHVQPVLFIGLHLKKILCNKMSSEVTKLANEWL